MSNFVTSGIATEISVYKLAVAVDQNHVGTQGRYIRKNKEA